MATSLHDKREWFEHDLKTVVRDGGFLSPLSFRYLELMRGKTLELPWLPGITPEVALPLAAHVGPLLLDGLTQLDPKSAKALASHGGLLSFQGLSELSMDLAQALSAHEGPLQLNGLTTITPEICQILSRHRGDLTLNGLTSLSEEAATALTPHRFSLSLDALGVLTDRTAFQLSLHEGNLSVKTLESITMMHGAPGEGLRRLMKKIGAPLPPGPIETNPIAMAQASGVHPLDLALTMDGETEWAVEDPLVPRFTGW